LPKGKGWKSLAVVAAVTSDEGRHIPLHDMREGLI